MGFKDLLVWHKSKGLAVDIYRFTNAPVLRKDFSLCDQMRRAAVSIASNIAEGDERDTAKDSIRFFYIAKASAAELLTQLEITAEVYDLDKSEIEPLIYSCDEIAKMLRGLITSRSRKSPPPTL